MPSKAPRESRSQPPRKRSFGTARRVPLKKPLTVADPWSARRGAARLQRRGTAAVSFVGRLLLLLVPASITKGGEIGEGGKQAASAPPRAARRRQLQLWLRHGRGDAVSGFAIYAATQSAAHSWRSTAAARYRATPSLI